MKAEQWSSIDRATFYYFVANAHDDLRRREAKTIKDRWEWANKHVEQWLLALRRARNEPAFDVLPLERQCQILTNLGNALSGIGRFIEALDVWNQALRIDEAFPMALANRADSQFHYPKALYDKGHREAFLHPALTDFLAALHRIPYPDARAYFTSIKKTIAKVLPPEAATTPHKFRSFPLEGEDRRPESRDAHSHTSRSLRSGVTSLGPKLLVRSPHAITSSSPRTRCALPSSSTRSCISTSFLGYSSARKQSSKKRALHCMRSTVPSLRRSKRHQMSGPQPFKPASST